MFCWLYCSCPAAQFITELSTSMPTKAFPWPHTSHPVHFTETNGKSCSPGLLQHLYLVAIVALVQLFLVPIMSVARYLVAQDVVGPRHHSHREEAAVETALICEYLALPDDPVFTRPHETQLQGFRIKLLGLIVGRGVEEIKAVQRATMSLLYLNLSLQLRTIATYKDGLCWWQGGQYVNLSKFS